jgi:hypothetical protein
MGEGGVEKGKGVTINNELGSFIHAISWPLTFFSGRVMTLFSEIQSSNYCQIMTLGEQ